MQIFIVQLQSRVIRMARGFIKQYPALSHFYNKQSESIKEFQFVKNGVIVNTIADISIIDWSTISNEYDFVIMSWVDNNNQCTYKRIIQNPSGTSFEYICNYILEYVDNMKELSTISFILVEVKIGEKIYKIDLKSDKYNYYVKFTRFTKDFFAFFLKHHLHENLTESDINNMCLKIIDNDVNKVEIDFSKNSYSILLLKNSYEIQNLL